MPTVAEIVADLEAFALPGLAADWDNVGLLLGRRDRPVARLMTCLTVTPESAAEAIERSAGLIVSHHPILFRPTKRLTGDTVEGRMVLDLTRAEVAVYSPHTAFDNCPGGINDHLAGLLGLANVGPLRARTAGPRQVKVVAFVPDGDLGRVSDAVFAAGAGVIGAYDECSYRVAGKGTFKGSDASNPTVGQKGRREEVEEWRVEFVCPEARLGAALAALRRAHSYETPAFDVYPLAALPGPGEGRLGRLPRPTTLGELAGAGPEGVRQRPGRRRRRPRPPGVVGGAGVRRGRRVPRGRGAGRGRRLPHRRGALPRTARREGARHRDDPAGPPRDRTAGRRDARAAAGGTLPPASRRGPASARRTRWAGRDGLASGASGAASARRSLRHLRVAHDRRADAAPLAPETPPWNPR